VGEHYRGYFPAGYKRDTEILCTYLTNRIFPVKLVSALPFIITQERKDNLIFILSYHWIHITVHHRVDRVLGFFSSRPNWDYPTPSQQTSLSPPPPVGSGGHTRLRKRGWEGPNSDQVTDTVRQLLQSATPPH
jgi:hypothetical protein